MSCRVNKYKTSKSINKSEKVEDLILNDVENYIEKLNKDKIFEVLEIRIFYSYFSSPIIKVYVKVKNNRKWYEISRDIPRSVNIDGILPRMFGYSTKFEISLVEF